MQFGELRCNYKSNIDLNLQNTKKRIPYYVEMRYIAKWYTKIE